METPGWVSGITLAHEGSASGFLQMPKLSLAGKE